MSARSFLAQIHEQKQIELITKINEAIVQRARQYVVEWEDNRTITHGIGNLEEFVTGKPVAEIDDQGVLTGTHILCYAFELVDSYEIDEFTFKVERQGNALVICDVVRQ